MNLELVFTVRVLQSVPFPEFYDRTGDCLYTSMARLRTFGRYEAILNQ